MCWNLDEEKMSRAAAAFITDCSQYNVSITRITRYALWYG